MIFINTPAVSRLFLVAVRGTLSRRTQDRLRIIAGSLSEVRMASLTSLVQLHVGRARAVRLAPKVWRIQRQCREQYLHGRDCSKAFLEEWETRYLVFTSLVLCS